MRLSKLLTSKFELYYLLNIYIKLLLDNLEKMICSTKSFRRKRKVRMITLYARLFHKELIRNHIKQYRLSTSPNLPLALFSLEFLLVGKMVSWKNVTAPILLVYLPDSIELFIIRNWDGLIEKEGKQV